MSEQRGCHYCGQEALPGAIYCSTDCVERYEATREMSEAFTTYLAALIRINDKCHRHGLTDDLRGTLQDALDAYVVAVARQTRENK